MRILDEADLRWVAGGWDSQGNPENGDSKFEGGIEYVWYDGQWANVVDDIVVTGHNHEDGCCGSESPYPDASDDPPPPPEEEECPWPEEDPAPPPPPPPPPVEDPKPEGWKECLDRKADTFAKEIHDEIVSKNDKINEWGALIWKDADGNLHRTDLVQGTPRNVNLFTGSPTDHGFQSWSQVVGVVHSHPTHTQLTNNNGTPNDTSDDTPYLHSDGTPFIPVSSEGRAWLPSDQDHLIMDDIASRSGADVANLRQYISHGADTKEFDYYNNKNTHLVGAERHAASKASSSYQPGATCPSN